MNPLSLWVFACALVVSWGWALSIFRGLYAFFYIPVFFLLIYCAFKLPLAFSGEGTIRKLVRRGRARFFTHRMILPGLFYFSALLLLLKGLAFDPSHEDGLCYRIPRAMQWVTHHGWIWAPWQDVRLNTRGTTSEWLSVPILMWFHSDRLVFLPNWISQLFLPGLIFSFWREIGVSQKISWMAMWLLPAGFCFLLQAANTSNDSIGTFFVLAALFYAFKARRTAAWEAVALSILSMALATNVKLNCVPLILPWLIVIFPSWTVLLSRPLMLFGLMLLAFGCSFGPESLVCWWHGAGFTGLGFDVYLATPPWTIGLLGNCFVILMQNIWPPLAAGFSWSTQLSSVIKDSLLGQSLNAYFMPDWAFHYEHVAVEQAGLGLPIVVAFGLLFILTRRNSGSLPCRPADIFTVRVGVIVGIWVALLHYLVFTNSDQPARLVCTYYPLLLGALFVGRHFFGRLSAAFFHFVATIAILVSLLASLCLSEGSFLMKGLNQQGYEYDASSVILNRAVPESENTIGVIRFWNEREAWIWKPYGKRTVIEISSHASNPEITAYSVHYLVIYDKQLRTDGLTMKDWIGQHNAQLVDMHNAGGHLWYCVKLPAADSTVK